jgi:hypothetical protein
MPAKIAANERMVIGLLVVSASADEYAPASRKPLVALSAACPAGSARSVRTPRYSRKPPPTSRNHNRCSTRSVARAVTPKLAIAA